MNELETLRQALAQESQARTKAELDLLDVQQRLKHSQEELQAKEQKLVQLKALVQQETRLIKRLAGDSPNPVVRYDLTQNAIVFYNTTASGIIDTMENADTFWKEAAQKSCTGIHGHEFDIHSQGRAFQFWSIPVPEDGYVNFYGREVTEAHNALKKFKENAYRLSALVENMSSGVLLEDADRNIVLVNQEFCEMFDIGAPPSALEGANCQDYAEREKHKFLESEVFVKTIETRLIEKEKATDLLISTKGRILERDYTPIWAGGEYLGHLWQFRDITHKKQEEDQLKQNDEKYRNIMESLQIGFIELNNRFAISKA